MQNSDVQFATKSRVHIAFAAGDIEASQRFYRTVFGVEPTKIRPGYARFEVAEPPLNLSIVALFLMVATASHNAAAGLEWVRVSDDSKGFVLTESGQPFVPWGFNYDHEGDGELLEDYWDDEWPTVESAFREMKELGANVVRIHLLL